MEGAFVSLLSQGVCQTRAAELAGYAHPDVQAVGLVRRPAIREALFVKRQGVIEGTLATAALGTMRGLIEGGDVPAAVRFAAARWVLEAAGHRAEAGAEDAGREKPLAEMSMAELEAEARKVEQLQAALDAVLDNLKAALPRDVEGEAVEASR